MKFTQTKTFSLSASDLANHLACKHLTELNRALATGKVAPPEWHDPDLARIQELGLAHEKAFVAHLRTKGLQVVELRDEDGENAFQRTLDAMREGKDVIVQAALQSEQWNGCADILYLVDESSELGDWSYEVIDTKLAQNTRGCTVLQLCLYSELVGKIQGRMPTRMHVVKPGAAFPWESFLFAEFRAYYRLIQNQLESTISAMPRTTYPNPVPHCDICRWWKECDTKRRADDHLSLVAGMTSLHRTKLERQEINTLVQFAESENPLNERPKYGTLETYSKLHAQARVQLEGRQQEKLVYRLLSPESGYGFFRLPEPSRGDIFFDIESDTFVDSGGLEYLLGFVYVDDDKTWEYRADWALDRRQEKQAFEQFIDFLTARWKKYPDMYIYHFSPYEPAALKRLMGRHNTRQVELDELLRGERFVDLHAIAKQGLLASVESYGLKNLERFCNFDRAVELKTADSARRRVEYVLGLGAASELTDTDRDAVQGYNRDDCFATLFLRNWLEERRDELIRQGHSVPRAEVKDEQASENVQERDEKIKNLSEQLLDGLPENQDLWEKAHKTKWLLANILGYFRREEKSAAWESFRLSDLTYDELLEDNKGIAGLEFVESIEPTGRAKVPIHCYRFPPQEVFLKKSSIICEVGGAEIGTLHKIDPPTYRIEIKKKQPTIDIHPVAVFGRERFDQRGLEASILQLVQSILHYGLGNNGPFKAAQDILLKNRPRLTGSVDDILLRTSESTLDAATRIAKILDNSILPIQGPPGTGKSYTAARTVKTKSSPPNNEQVALVPKQNFTNSL